MDALKTMWETIPPATESELAGARRRLLSGIHSRRRLVTTPRLLVAAGATATAVATALVLGSGAPAYAVAESPDGTLTVTVNELHDPDGLEAKLAAAGVKADVTFLAPGTLCAPPRFTGVDATYGGPPADGPGKLRSATKAARSSQAATVTSVRTIRIAPEHIRPGETLVMEFRDNLNAQVPWHLGMWLAKAGSPVKPCAPIKEIR